MVTDDPGFSDYGFNGDADSTGSAAAGGCAVVRGPGRRGSAPFGLAALLIGASLVERRRRRRDTRC